MQNLTLTQLAVLSVMTRPMLIREMASRVEDGFGISNVVARDCCWQLRQLHLLVAVEDKVLPTTEGLTLAMDMLDSLNGSRIKFLSDLRKQRVI